MELLTKEQHKEHLNNIIQTIKDRITFHKSVLNTLKIEYPYADNNIVINHLKSQENYISTLEKQLNYLLYLEANIDSIIQMGVDDND